MLPPRKAPYYQGLGRCRALGFRKTLTGLGTWIARWTNHQHVHTTRSLGRVDELEHGEAVARAQRWFEQCQAGVAHSGTVAEACRDHVANLKVEKGEYAASFVRGRFELYLRSAHIDAVAASAASSKRNERAR
jgi:hypothetical protein